MKWFVILLFIKAVYSADHNPDENAGVNNPNLFEGDMILSQEQIRRAKAGEDIDTPTQRGSSRYKHWPKGIVIYVIDRSLSRYYRALTEVKAGMAEWASKTCIRFKRRTNERAYVVFRRGSGCSSYVGRTGYRQYINLASGCWKKGVVAHEIGHALGLYHEQSRPDRDKYITVLFRNIRSGKAGNFRKYPRSTIDSLGFQYDYNSVMHYGSKFFSRNGRPTIVVKTPGARIGQRQGLSTIDAKQSNEMYKNKCTDRGEEPTTMPLTTTPTTKETTSKPPTPPKPTSGNCRDIYNCIGWENFCRRWLFVRQNCKKTCGLC